MRSRCLVVAIALLGCKSHPTDSPPNLATANAPSASDASSAPSIGDAASGARVRLELPEVSAADVVATPSGRTPLLVLVDNGGKVSFGVGSTWNTLASYDPAGAVRDDDLEDAGKLLYEARVRQMTPAQVVAALSGDTPKAGDDHNVGVFDEGKMGKAAARRSRGPSTTRRWISPVALARCRRSAAAPT